MSAKKAKNLLKKARGCHGRGEHEAAITFAQKAIEVGEGLLFAKQARTLIELSRQLLTSSGGVEVSGGLREKLNRLFGRDTEVEWDGSRRAFSFIDYDDMVENYVSPAMEAAGFDFDEWFAQHLFTVKELPTPEGNDTVGAKFEELEWIPVGISLGNSSIENGIDDQSLSLVLFLDPTSEALYLVDQVDRRVTKISSIEKLSVLVLDDHLEWVHHPW